MRIPAALTLAVLASLLAGSRAAAETIEGELRVVVGDLANGRHAQQEELAIQSPDGLVKLAGDHLPEGLVSGALVWATGGYQGLSLRLASGAALRVLRPPPPHPPQRADQTAIVLVNFQDDEGTPVGLGAAESLVFGELNRYLDENSYGRFKLAGRAYGWYTLDIPRTCEWEPLEKAALRAMAEHPEVPWHQHRRIILMYPGPCGVAWGSVGEWTLQVSTASPAFQASISWIPFPWHDHVQVLSHEVGHNLGLEHANSLNCRREEDGEPKCQDIEYGDDYDSMGGPKAHYNVLYKKQLGWLAPGQLAWPKKPGAYRYRLSPLAVRGGLKGIFIPATGPTGVQGHYAVEYRRGLGYDRSAIPDPYIGAVVVHMSMANEHESADGPVQTRPHSHMLQPVLVVDLSKRGPRDGSFSIPSGFYDKKSGIWIQPLRTKGRDLEVLVRIVDRRKKSKPRSPDADEEHEHRREPAQAR